MEENTTQVKEALRQWISADDQIRELRAQIKTLNEQKKTHGDMVLSFMRENSVDDFKIEGSGSISRSVRNVRPVIKRSTIRTQLLLTFADQPQKVSEALRAIEGVDEDNNTGIIKELLTRRVSRKQNTLTSLTE